MGLSMGVKEIELLKDEGSCYVEILVFNGCILSVTVYF